MQLPVFFEAPATPLRTKHIDVTESTTPRELTLRTMFAAKKYTVPGGLLLIVHQLCAALVPVIMGVAIDRAISTNDSGQLVLWVVVLAVDFASYRSPSGSDPASDSSACSRFSIRCGRGSPTGSSMRGDWVVRRGNPECC